MEGSLYKQILQCIIKKTPTFSIMYSPLVNDFGLGCILKSLHILELYGDALMLTINNGDTDSRLWIE